MPEMTTYERAVQIWQVLIAAAHNRQTVTYDMLGDMIGVFRAGLGPHLEHIQRYCANNDLPHLTALVVRTGAGQPASGYKGSGDIDRDRERVYDHKWFAMKPLTVEMLREGK